MKEGNKRKAPNGPPRKKKHGDFGRVMQQVPTRNRPRLSTVSIALPGSVVANCQTKELKTCLVGQIARAATIYHVDEIVVYDDKTSDPKANEFMANILQFCECPQYLRRHFFPLHPNLQFVGLLAPIDAPHHVRQSDNSKYREGVVLEKTGTKGSFVNVGLTKPLEIDQRLTPGIRCTVQILPGQKGKVVSPSAPREENGMYWGYACRMAASLQAVFDECPFEEGYDLKIGTSERGSVSLDDKGYTVPKYRHALIVFGGVAGLEECVNADESIKLGANQTHTLFDQYVNICPYQGSRTIRTEEAVLICLAKMSPVLSSSESTDEKREPQVQTKVEFDDSPSEESSDDE